MAEKEEQERVRKQSKHGTTTQKMLAFRLDLDLAEWLQRQKNKGRYINDLIRRDRERWRQVREDAKMAKYYERGIDPDERPEERDDYQA